MSPRHIVLAAAALFAALPAARAQAGRVHDHPRTDAEDTAVASTPPDPHAGMNHDAGDDAHPRAPAAGDVARPAHVMHDHDTHSAESSPPVGHEARDSADEVTPLPGVDAGASGHAGMDHGAMAHDAQGHDAREQDETPAHRHAGTTHAPATDLPAGAAPRTPIPVPTESDRAAAFPPGLHGHSAHDRRIQSYWLADRLEWQDDAGAAWEGLAWVGGDIQRIWLRTGGEYRDGRVVHGHVEALYGRSVTPWWDVMAGARRDLGDGPQHTWLAIGVQGLAPYKFELDATAYVGPGGRTALVLGAEYDTLVTNRLILQWQAETTFHGRDDPEHAQGRGLATAEAGLRLRYEVSRRIAPYLGLVTTRAFGRTARLLREQGESAGDTRVVAGLRFWF